MKLCLSRNFRRRIRIHKIPGRIPRPHPEPEEYKPEGEPDVIDTPLDPLPA